MGERVVVPRRTGRPRHLQGDGDACVVAAPPHPQHGGTRSDRRLQAVSDALTERGLACLRFDYGPWDEGHEARLERAPRNERAAAAASRGERRDVANAIDWARERYDRVGVFGYSFGATVGLVAAQAAEPNAVSALAPDAIATDALLGLTCPVQVIYGERDETVAWEPVVEGARERGYLVSGVDDDHWFERERERVVELASVFLARVLDGTAAGND